MEREKKLATVDINNRPGQSQMLLPTILICLFNILKQS